MLKLSGKLNSYFIIQKSVISLSSHSIKLGDYNNLASSETHGVVSGVGEKKQQRKVQV